MSVVGCFFVPHGCLVLTGDSEYNHDQPAFDVSSSPSKCLRLQTALIGISQKISELNPDIILLSTPHSKIYTHYQNLLFSNPSASGSAEWLSKWPEYHLSISLHSEISQNLLSTLRKKHHHEDIDIATYADNKENLPLRWGEVVPLWFLHQRKEDLRYVLLAQARRLLLEDPAVGRAKLGRLGEDLRESVEGCMVGLRVVVLVSGDLSHCHSSSPDSPFPFHPGSGGFDRHVARWAESMDPEELDRAAGLAGEVRCCGFAGLLMLEGFLRRHAEKDKKDLQEAWTSQLWAYEVPSYYGMMVASFLPK
eukprot:TRINITY_DN3241_c1_g1_i1.p1 TRINITY_DN3241_c1_g1~~TRINITY_DN3241_c1_g1_i1.p1  ORF type:complete len:307 (-),score=41.11 TRINITY_DN3241_c1_g1_i1:65-985(-)